MLSWLRISNYAIIDDLEIEMLDGFSVMTGETGAGKSILVDALGLALGDRADAGAVRKGAERAEISLAFDLEPAHPVRNWLTDRGLDDEDLCCLRRAITSEGRSRAWVNNRPVTLKDLRAVGSQLVDIHGQHAHQSLLTARAQRRILDASGDLEALAKRVARAFAEWQSAVRERDRSGSDGAEREAELELLRFQLGEFEALDVNDGEPEALRQESARLRHVDQLRHAIGAAAEALYESDAGSAHSLTSQAASLIDGVLEHESALEGIHERLSATEIELREIGSDLARLMDQIEADPARLEEVEQRLDRIRQLARRHRVDESEVPAIGERLRARIDELDANADSIASLDRRCDAALEEFLALAEQLSKARRDAAGALGKAATGKLRELGLPHATLTVTVTRKADSKHDSTGIDQVSFSVTTNAGEPPGPIDRIASGGELARIGLALAVVATDASPIPTLVFDEVDAGIGGAVAEVVGRRLKEIAALRQVLCVTHLPQVASQGHHHFRIFKLTDGNATRTQVRRLDSDQRIEELSRMLGGVEITAATRAHAEEMIRQAAGS